MTYATILDAMNALKQGKMIILVDHEDRENEGDLVIAAEYATPAAINFMIKEARGLVCLSLPAQTIDRLQLPMMTTHNTSRLKTAFTVSIEAKEGVSSGISAFDRAHTIAVAIDERTQSSDWVSPGHVFPLRACEGGVLARNGHTEGSLDLVRLAGLKPAAVICEVINDDGTMARADDLRQFAKKHQLLTVSIQALIAYRAMHEVIVDELASAHLPIEGLGDFIVKVFKSKYDDVEHVALIKPSYDPNHDVLVRIHSECLTGDVFHSARCDCGLQRDEALRRISLEGGVLVYLRQEGRGIGLANKIKAYALQDTGMDTVQANKALGFPTDARSYAVCASILKFLGLKKLKLLTNNPAKIEELKDYNFETITRVALVIAPNSFNARYLETKKNKLGHLF